MNWIQFAARHIDTKGVVWRYYNKPTHPLPPPEGSRWIPLKQDFPRFKDRSESLIQLRLRKIEVRHHRENERWQKQQQKRQRERLREYERESLIEENRRRLQYEEQRKQRLTSITKDRAIMIAERLNLKGWKRIATGTWKNEKKSNLLMIVFRCHTWNEDQFFLEAHFKKSR